MAGWKTMSDTVLYGKYHIKKEEKANVPFLFFLCHNHIYNWLYFFP